MNSKVLGYMYKDIIDWLKHNMIFFSKNVVRCFLYELLQYLCYFRILTSDDKQNIQTQHLYLQLGMYDSTVSNKG
jgi:hypothetical protein